MNCTCPIRRGASYDELVEEVIRANKMCTQGSGLTNVGYMCPVLTKALNYAHTSRSARERNTKKLKSAGYTEEQIREMPTRRRSGGIRQETAPTLNFDDFM